MNIQTARIHKDNLPLFTQYFFNHIINGIINYPGRSGIICRLQMATSFIDYCGIMKIFFHKQQMSAAIGSFSPHFPNRRSYPAFTYSFFQIFKDLLALSGQAFFHQRPD